MTYKFRNDKCNLYGEHHLFGPEGFWNCHEWSKQAKVCLDCEMKDTKKWTSNAVLYASSTGWQKVSLFKKWYVKWLWIHCFAPKFPSYWVAMIFKHLCRCRSNLDIFIISIKCQIPKLNIQWHCTGFTWSHIGIYQVLLQIWRYMNVIFAGL